MQTSSGAVRSSTQVRSQLVLSQEIISQSTNSNLHAAGANAASQSGISFLSQQQSSTTGPRVIVLDNQQLNSQIIARHNGQLILLNNSQQTAPTQKRLANTNQARAQKKRRGPFVPNVPVPSPPTMTRSQLSIASPTLSSATALPVYQTHQGPIDARLRNSGARVPRVASQPAIMTSTAGVSSITSAPATVVSEAQVPTAASPPALLASAGQASSSSPALLASAGPSSTVTSSPSFLTPASQVSQVAPVPALLAPQNMNLTGRPLTYPTNPGLGTPAALGTGNLQATYGQALYPPMPIYDIQNGKNVHSIIFQM